MFISALANSGGSIVSSRQLLRILKRSFPPIHLSHLIKLLISGLFHSETGTFLGCQYFCSPRAYLRLRPHQPWLLRCSGELCAGPDVYLGHRHLLLSREVVPIMPTELEEVRDISVQSNLLVLIMLARWFPPPR